MSLSKKKLALMMMAAMLSAAVLTGCTGDVESGTESVNIDPASSPQQSESGSESVDLLSQIRERGEITIAMEGTWAPWTYHDEEDNLVGSQFCRGRVGWSACRTGCRTL